MIPIVAYYFFYSPWMLLAIPGMLVGLFAQWRLHSAYGRYSRQDTQRQMTGAQTARLLLDRNGMANVEIFETTGEMTDHFDPSRRAVFLSPDVAHGRSVASVAIAAHEVGHAIQNRMDYHFFRFRMLLVGTTGLATNASVILFMLGMFLSGVVSHWLLLAGIGLYSIFVFFQLVTLPVEYDASRRARRELIRLGVIVEGEQRDVGRMLNAAALTYVAALLTAFFELIKLVGMAASRGTFDRNRD